MAAMTLARTIRRIRFRPRTGLLVIHGRRNKTGEAHAANPIELSATPIEKRRNTKTNRSAVMIWLPDSASTRGQ